MHKNGPTTQGDAYTSPYYIKSVVKLQSLKFYLNIFFNLKYNNKNNLATK